ncbi:hypothetical protein CJ030_MR5G015918 [Morella rubra]|uniref:Malectin domain-containing protein n=1 Tax=Morella rubra TaxID=262757 RepID=A0A6A1VK20_9ROSI|nr:hypothetical protein CJ030_MR5G015918 [Morella rubra]
MGGYFLKGPMPSSISALTSLSDLEKELDENSRDKVEICIMISEMFYRNKFLRLSPTGEVCQISGLFCDLSFNDLNGEIPSSFVQLDKVDFMEQAQWKYTRMAPRKKQKCDVSYNNFTWESSGPLECPHGSKQWKAIPHQWISYISSSIPSICCRTGIHPCGLKRNVPCPAMNNQHYSLRINCGGKEANVSGDQYEADREQRGASMFYWHQNWAFSSTGNFMDNNIDADIYIQTNSSALFNVSVLDSELYTTSRISPLSLTYYGLCLMNGNYTVKLHFAEITFRDDRSFNSLGKRIFNVHLQDKLVLENFNIEDEAGGVGKPLLADFKPPSDESNANHVKITIGTVVAVIFFLVQVIGVMWRKGWLGGKVSVDKGIDLQTVLFTLRQIRAATRNFDPAKKLGEGGFGSVYKWTFRISCGKNLYLLTEF